MAYFKEFKINTDNMTGDAFGRVRSSFSHSLLDSKLTHSAESLIWDDQQISGAGTTSTFSANRASNTLAVALNTAGRRVRQTFQRFNYQTVEWLLIMNPTVAGSFTYSDVTGASVQTAMGATANTVTGGTVIDGGHLAVVGAGAADERDVLNMLRLGSSIAGVADTIVLCARPINSTANASIFAGIKWRELA